MTGTMIMIGNTNRTHWDTPTGAHSGFSFRVRSIKFRPFFKPQREMALRYALSITLVLGITLAFAQGPVVRYVQADAPIELLELRAITEAMTDLDPNARVHQHFNDQSILQININPQVSEAEMRQAVVASGTSLRAETPVITPQQPVYTRPDGRPLYVVTGEGTADRERYRQAVEEWNNNNPNDRNEMPLPAANDQ